MLRKLGLVAITVLCVACLVVGCRAAPGDATPSPTHPPSPLPRHTSNPTPWQGPTLEPTPTTVPPTSTPDGPMPSVLAQLDLGVAAGNAYRPTALAVDEAGIAFVLCETCDTCAARQGAISVVDLRKGRVLDVWLLPGAAWGPLTVGGGWLYVNYEDAAYRERLLVLDTANGQVRGDIGIEWVNSADRLWLDVARGRLYLPHMDGLQVRAVDSLEVVASLDYAFRAVDRRVVGDMQADRLYVSLSNVLYAYRASDLAPLWELDVPAERIDDLLLDARSGALWVQGATADLAEPNAELFMVSAEGQVQARLRPSGVGAQWRLAWADVDAEHIVLQETLWGQVGQSQLRLTMVDLQGRAVGQPLALGGSNAVDRLPHDAALYVLRRDAHMLTVLDGASLTGGAGVALGVELRDLAVDADANRLYVNDTAGRLYELDTARLDLRALRVRRSTLAGSGQLLLDAPGRTLLAAQADGDAARVSVVNLATLRVTQVITGGDQLALDTRRGRALVGSYAAGYPPDQGEVQVWDLASGKRMGAIAQAGPPVYNPVRDEVYVAGYSCHVYDAETLAERGSLTPDIDAQECKGCTGQPAVWGAVVYPQYNALVVKMMTTTAGHGAGTTPDPRVFTLDALTPITHALTLLAVSDEAYLAYPPVDGRVHENVAFSSYVSRANVVVWRANSDERLAWRDGLAFDLLTPDGKLGFVVRDERWLAIDTQTMTPLGYTPRYAVHSYDSQRDLFFALDGSRLTVLRARWGQAERNAGPVQTALGAHVRAVLASPGFADDQTLFVVNELALYRSRDGGGTYERLQGGLPQIQNAGDAGLVLAISPDYARDRTVYAGGWDRGSRGFGVWRSVDGGDSWQAVWDGLTHLRVERLAISPHYTEDRALAAYCDYADLTGAGWGHSVFVSRDRGAHWSLAAETNDTFSNPLPQPDALFGVVSVQSPVAPGIGYNGVGIGEGEDYQQLLTFPEGESYVAQALSPAYPADQTLYVLSSYHLYRSLDGGATWQQAQGAFFEGRNYERRLTVLTVTEDAQGGALLVLADDAGQLVVLSAAGLEWVAV